MLLRLSLARLLHLVLRRLQVAADQVIAILQFGLLVLGGASWMVTILILIHLKLTFSF